MKTSAKYFGLAENGPKTTSLMTSLTKNPQPKPKNYFSSVV